MGDDNNYFIPLFQYDLFNSGKAHFNNSATQKSINMIIQVTVFIPCFSIKTITLLTI